jgi:hypothetical protein
MCRFFSTVGTSTHGAHLYKIDDWSVTFVLRGVAADEVFTNFGTDKVVFDTNVLILEQDSKPNSYRHFVWLINSRMRSMYGVRLLNPEAFDVEATNHWIAYCQSNHGATCRLQSLPRMQSFQVIDCETKSIIKAPPQCLYVALSYVWGGCSTTESSPSILECAPKLILDSIEVTKKLKFKYLWVDRYCIDQSDSGGKHEQICRMDMIYASAQVTIIAAGSEDPSRGLHGVRGTLRTPQPTLRLGDYQIVSSLANPASMIEGSKWATRGWTYQEGLLSTRRLIFSEDQVRFECNSMHCSEAIHLPLDEMHDQRTGKMDFYVPLGAFEKKDIGAKPWQFMDYVAQFSQRELSFPADALNAMRGIFNMFEKGRYPVFQLMGVPIMPPYIKTDSPLRAPKEKEYQIISRSPSAGFLIGLLWQHHSYGLSVPHLASRSHLFPSWTWAACSLEIAPYLGIHPMCTLRDFGAQVSVELPDGSILPFPISYSAIPAFISQARDSKIIHITAKVSSCQIIFYESVCSTPVTGYAALLTGDNELTICLQFSSDMFINDGSHSEMDPSLVGKQFTAIIFALYTPASSAERQVSERQISVIVVDEDSNDNFGKRVGICLPRQNLFTEGFLASGKLGAAPLLSTGCDRDTRLGKAKQQDLRNWVDRRSTRTIRLG